MINISMNSTMLNLLSSNYITWEECKNVCVEQILEIKYEFVWLFIIGFVFTESARFIHYIPNESIDSNLKLRLTRGFKLAGYLLQLTGIFYYLVFVI